MPSSSRRRSKVFLWFDHPDDYDRIRLLVGDHELLSSSFDEWQKKTREMIAKFEGAGGVARKAIIDPDSFMAWCQARGMESNFATLGAAITFLDAENEK